MALLLVDTRISIHAPREGCDFPARHPARPGRGISIHAPREWCDTHEMWLPVMDGAFQSTHPVRGATVNDIPTKVPLYISIHAPREGCDYFDSNTQSDKTDFNPRTP